MIVSILAQRLGCQAARSAAIYEREIEQMNTIAAVHKQCVAYRVQSVERLIRYGYHYEVNRTSDRAITAIPTTKDVDVTEFSGSYRSAGGSSSVIEVNTMMPATMLYMTPKTVSSIIGARTAQASRAAKISESPETNPQQKALKRFPVA
jgi:hypothetical protein